MAIANLQLARGESSNGLAWQAGVGLSTGVTVADASLHFKVLGCGLTMGRKWGISVLDNEVAFDVGKAFASPGQHDKGGIDNDKKQRRRRRSSGRAAGGGDNEELMALARSSSLCVARRKPERFIV